MEAPPPAQATPAHLRAVPVPGVMALGVPGSVVVLVLNVLVGDVVLLAALATTEPHPERAASAERAPRGGQIGLRLEAMTQAAGRPVDYAMFAGTARRPGGRAAPGHRLRGLPARVRRGTAAMVRIAVTVATRAVAGTTAPVAAARLALGAVAKARAVRPPELAGTTA